ncbi:radical SAM protein [Candidatus Woesearchaeota archaeon]|nr:radical SAM protein [Candidatus Woesearchaeota archaeon]
MAIFLAGCDFNCPYCNTPELIDFKEEYLIDVLSLKREITNNSNNADSVFFTGGEPCLQRQALLALARHSKNAGLGVGLSTNGSNPKTIKSLLNEDLLDYVELDLKTEFEEKSFEKATRSKNFFNPTSQILQSLYETMKLLRVANRKVKLTFKTTIVPGLNDDIETLQRIANRIGDYDAVWKLRSFDNEKTLDKDYQEKTPVPKENLLVLKEKLETQNPNLIIET